MPKVVLPRTYEKWLKKNPDGFDGDVQIYTINNEPKIEVDKDIIHIGGSTYGDDIYCKNNGGEEIYCNNYECGDPNTYVYKNFNKFAKDYGVPVVTTEQKVGIVIAITSCAVAIGYRVYRFVKFLKKKSARR